MFVMATRTRGHRQTPGHQCVHVVKAFADDHVVYTCERCGKALTTRQRNRGRRFCGQECVSAFRRGEADERASVRTHPCPTCGEAVDGYRLRFCSKSCSATYNNLLRDPRVGGKQCLRCGLKVAKASNTYCSRACQASHRIERWLSGELVVAPDSGDVPKWIRRYLMKRDGAKCSQCGWCEVHRTTGQVPVEVDHEDGDYRNNNPENLRLLCPNCHSLTPTYRNLNRGRGRPSRRANRHPVIV